MKYLQVGNRYLWRFQEYTCSASARISKGQGYEGFLRKRAGSSFGKKSQFAWYKEKLEKWI
jgi:hypothetical protein